MTAQRIENAEKTVTVRLSHEEWSAAKERFPRRGASASSFQQLFSDRLQTFIRDEKAVAIPDKIGNTDLSAEERKWTEMVLRVLRSEDEETIKALKSNLRVFFRDVGGDPNNVDFSKPPRGRTGR